MRHVEKALNKYNAECYPNIPNGFIQIENVEDVKGVAPIVSFTIQSDPIKEVGVNGVQATDMLKYVQHLFESLDEAFPCRENKSTIDMIKAALFFQDLRTQNRKERGVEGENKL